MGKLSGKKDTVRIQLGKKEITVHRYRPTSISTLIKKKPNWGSIKMKLCDTCAKTHGGFTDDAYKRYMETCQKRGGSADKAAIWLTSQSPKANDAIFKAITKTKFEMKKNPDGTFQKLMDAVITPGVMHVPRVVKGTKKIKNARTIRSPARPYTI